MSETFDNKNKTTMVNPHEINDLLGRIQPDDYTVWLKVGCALKHLGMPYETFRTWSARSKKFDENECAQKWAHLPKEPRASWTTLKTYAAAASFSCCCTAVDHCPGWIQERLA